MERSHTYQTDGMNLGAISVVTGRKKGWRLISGLEMGHGSKLYQSKMKTQRSNELEDRESL